VLWYPEAKPFIEQQLASRGRPEETGNEHVRVHHELHLALRSSGMASVKLDMRHLPSTVIRFAVQLRHER